MDNKYDTTRTTVLQIHLYYFDQLEREVLLDWEKTTKSNDTQLVIK